MVLTKKLTVLSCKKTSKHLHFCERHFIISYKLFLKRRTRIMAEFVTFEDVSKVYHSGEVEIRAVDHISFTIGKR